MRYEYIAIPAPNRAEKAKDARTPAERYGLTLTAELNRMAQDGWDYVRAETLPSEERSGLTGRTTVYHNVLVFRRPLVVAVAPLPAIAPPAQPETVLESAPDDIEATDPKDGA